MTQSSLSSGVLDVVIVGAGFGGLCAAIQLLQQQPDLRFVILEKNNEIGGTWYENSYPGAACDVQSHLYSFSFAPKHDWSKRYAGWQEIQDYLLSCVEKFKLRRFIQFGQTVNRAIFDDETQLWNITTASGDSLAARHWIMASGPLHVPQYPNIRGLEKFTGKVFHSARWDHQYDLQGKTVASIGTGGSAVQYLPEIAPDVKKLHVFQRTGAWVIPRDERVYSDFSKQLFEKFSRFRQFHRARLYWSNESRVWPIFNPKAAKGLQALATLFLKYQVKDPDTRRKLTPDYTIGCKRILISNKYYPTFNRDNVELITDGIREITATGIIDSTGKERQVDCIILGTGFVTDPRHYLGSMEIRGENGVQLLDTWKNGAEAFYGINTHGFPNFHLLLGPNTLLGHNSVVFMIECQVRYILSAMQLLKQQNARSLRIKPEVQESFNNWVQNSLKNTVWSSGCQSWYQQADGKNFTIWPSSTWRYWLRTRQARAEDYEFIK